MSLLPLAEAQQRLLALAAPLPPVAMALSEALGSYLAAPLMALRSQPGAALSSMDGYAIIWADKKGPWRIIGESAAGHGFKGSVARGEAVRISTGAIMPDGADTILVQEDAHRDGDMLTRSGDGPASKGAHIRSSGGDFQLGQTLVEAGLPLTPARIGLAIMAGHHSVTVHQRPSVAIFSTGDELLPAGEQPQNLSQIPSSNDPMLAAMVSPYCAQIHHGGIIADDQAALEAAISGAAAADIIVTSGGASVGDHDHLHAALSSLGVSIDFWRVAMKPGKPVMVGTLGKTIILGLPGNPVSAFVTATLFLLPLIRYLSGAAMPYPDQITAPISADMPAIGHRAEFVRAVFQNGILSPLPNQDSAALSTIAAANALIVRPANAPAANIGDNMGYIAIA